MGEDMQAGADERFSEALASSGARDPREFYRGLLRTLRERGEEEYAAAVAEYERDVVEAIAQGEREPLEAWLAFGIALAERMDPGRAVVIDDTGRSAPYAPPPRWDALILHLPAKRGARAIPVSIPPEPSPAQRATIDLLVKGKLRRS